MTPKTTTTSSESTTTSSTTTTTTPKGCTPVDIVFSVTNSEPLGAMQYDTDYSRTTGGFAGERGGVQCSQAVPGFGGLVAFNDQDSEKRLSSALANSGVFVGPGDIAICVFNACDPVTADDFVITITDQARPDLSPANATMGLRIVE